MPKSLTTLMVILLLPLQPHATEHLESQSSDTQAESSSSTTGDSVQDLWNWIKENSEPTLPYGYGGEGGTGANGGGSGGGGSGGGGGDGGGSGGH